MFTFLLYLSLVDVFFFSILLLFWPSAYASFSFQKHYRIVWVWIFSYLKGRWNVKVYQLYANLFLLFQIFCLFFFSVSSSSSN